jgi:hypothetical protein
VAASPAPGDGIIRRHLLGQIDVAVQIGAIGTTPHNNDTANGRGSSATALAGTIHPANATDQRDFHDRHLARPLHLAPLSRPQQSPRHSLR